MSRVGKQPIQIPSGVQTTIEGGQISVQGPKGKLTLSIGTGVKVEKQGSVLQVSRLGEDRTARSNFGTTRARLQAMVDGVTKGWKKSLELNGVGYNVSVAGQNLKMNCGYSHEVKIALPKEIKATTEKTTLHLESADLELLGTLAAKIRAVKPPEPYLGKGIKYTNEKIRRKAGKAGKK